MKTTVTGLFLTAMVAFAAFHVAGKIEIGGEGGWDYLAVDAAARRLYLSHASKVVVVDLETQKRISVKYAHTRDFSSHQNNYVISQ